jgi:phospho-N-acetylmuramoyl-pentapeptide-transferase
VSPALATEALIAGLAAAVAAALIVPAGIPWLKGLGFRQSVREQGPQSHLAKAGTPTMGGLLFLPVAALAALATFPTDPAVYVALFVSLGHGALGFVDDYRKTALGRPLGLKAREKLVGQTLLGLLLAVAALGPLHVGAWIAVPFTGLRLTLAPVLYAAFIVLVVIATTNATNLTDGADGLLATTALPPLAAFAVLALVQGQGGAAAVMLGLAGALIGFLRVNRHPAKAIMGDTGSMAIGGALAAVAVITHAELWLIWIGGLFVLEDLSVMVQVAYFRRTGGKRLLRMSPLHHHFELGGWSEPVLVRRFALASLALAASGVLVALAQGAALR